MHNFEQWILACIDKYNSSKTFMVESRNDPPDEPYRSKYKAKEILSNLLKDLECKFPKREDVKVIAVWSLLKFNIGVIDLETEEYSAGCDSLTECWELLKKISLESRCCTLALSVLNQLGILWSGRGEMSKAFSYLKEAENIYQNYKENSVICPFAIEDIFSLNTEPKSDWKPFEKVFTLTLYYLAQVYELLKDSEKSAKYCHMTLKRQRESEEFDEKEWAINCATLSQYYIQEKDYVTGRHLLACSSYVLSNYEASIDNRVENEDVWDEIRRSKAEVSWCWLKYCLNLLAELGSEECEKTETDTSSRLCSDPEVAAFESKVSLFVTSFDEAKKVFLFGLNHINEAKLYYTLSDHANNYVQLVQDNSKLYKSLILYEKDLGRQAKMHKRRIDMLEDTLSKLNIQFYLSVCRQLQFELGETYYELVDLKIKVMHSLPPDQAPSAVKKINSLVKKSTDYFTKFINTLKDKDGKLPDEISEDLVRPALVAHFYLGSLYSKIIESDPTKKVSNLLESEKNYQYILGYSKKNPNHCSFIEKELPVVKEMIELMPQRILQVTGSVLF